MKIKFLFVAFIASVLCSCNQETDELANSINSNQNSTERMLSFRTEQEFNNVVSMLSSMDTDNQLKWIQGVDEKFVSLFDVYEHAMNEAADLDESPEAYLSYRSKYANYLYFAEYKDDYGTYLPVSNPIIAKLINKNGDVKIGEKVVNKKDINSYRQLQCIGGTMYDDEVCHTLYSATRSYVPGDAFGEEYDSGWFHNNGKKIRVKCGRQYFDCQSPNPGNWIGYRMHIEISFRKKTWLGWTNYSSWVSYEGTYTLGVNPPVSISESKTADSSHDYYYGPFKAPFCTAPEINGGLGVFVPEMKVYLDVHYRGISDDNMPDYNITLKSFSTPF